MNKRCVYLLLFLISLLSTGPLRAQANIDHLFSLSLEELLQVKVTGPTLTPKELKTVPAAVTVFTHKQITNMGLDSLDELMNIVPGFQSYRSSLSSLSYHFSSRGRRIGNNGAEVLILVDGLRLAEPRTSGGASVVPKYPLMNIERVEFIRGPGSAVYGSNAMMGVVNIITRSNVQEINISAGSFNRLKGHLMTSQQSGDLNFNLFTAFETDEGDTFNVQDPFANGRINTQDPREFADLNLKLSWQDSKLNVHHNQFSTQDFYELDGVSNGYNRRTAQLTALSLQQGFRWQAVVSHVVLAYTRSYYSSASQLTAPGYFSNFSTPPSDDALFIRVNFDNTREARFLWHNDWASTAYSSVQFGIELRQIDVPQIWAQNNFDMADLASSSFPIRYYGNLHTSTLVQTPSQRDIVGVYGQYQQQWFDNTHLTLGLRHDDFSNIGAQFSPRFALVHELNVHHSIKLLYGEAFRAPAEDELHLLNNPLLLGNSKLAPETVKSSEFIWLGQWAHSGFSFGYFESRYENAIVQIVNGNISIFDNVQQDPSKGFELEATHQLNSAMIIRGTYTHILDVPEQSHRESDQIASLMVNIQQKSWNANIMATYLGGKSMSARDSNGERIPLEGYWLLAGKLRYFVQSNLQIFVQAKNLLDKNYLTPAGNINLTTGIPNRGREILAGFTLEF